MANPNYKIELYRLSVTQSRLDKIDEIITYDNLKYGDKLNGIGSASFSLDIHDPKGQIENLRRFVTQVAIKRNNTIVWVGGINKNSFSYQNNKGITNVSALSYLAHLSNRFTPSDYKKRSVDAGVIAWDLINTVQTRTNGELMIREGTIETIGDIDESLSYASVASALMNQSNNLTGYTFNFVPVQSANGNLDHILFNVYKYFGNVRNELPPLEIGTTVDRIVATTQDNITNSGTAEGAGTNNDVLTRIASNAPSQLAYTRREGVYSFKDISLGTTLQLKINNIINKFKVDRYDLNLDLTPNTELRYGAFGLGDILKCNIVLPNGFTIDNYVRVIELGVDVTKEGVEYLTPKVELIY